MQAWRCSDRSVTLPGWKVLTLVFWLHPMTQGFSRQWHWDSPPSIVGTADFVSAQPALPHSRLIQLRSASSKLNRSFDSPFRYRLGRTNPNPENEIVRHRFQAVNQKYTVWIF